MTEIVAFNYAGLSAKERRAAESNAKEIRALLERTGAAIVEIGRRLIAVREALGSAKFAAWLKRRLSEVRPQPLRWLWFGRIPLGKLTLISGDPGLGKSFLTIDLAARVSTGRPWPDSRDVENRRGSVLLFSAEDSPEDTIRPRLDAAGGDPDRVLVVDGVFAAAVRNERPRAFCLESDLPALESKLAEFEDCRLLVIDPITAYGNGQTDTHRNSDVRAMLQPLSELAARHGVAIVAVSHLNKDGSGKAIYRTTGSLAFVAAARTAWLVTKDRNDENRRLFLQQKNNLAADPGGLAYRVEYCERSKTGRLEWESDLLSPSADELLSSEATRDPGDRTATVDAEDFLRSYLANGPVWSVEVMEEASKERISAKALRNARERLCKSPPSRDRFGPGSKVFWELKADPGEHPGHIDARIDAIDAPLPERASMGIYEGNGHARNGHPESSDRDFQEVP